MYENTQFKEQLKSQFFTHHKNIVVNECLPSPDIYIIFPLTMAYEKAKILYSVHLHCISIECVLLTEAPSQLTSLTERAALY